MQRYICIHGHFYQPPRENPWLEAIELQDSAYPYHDWNQRIAAECYAPNSASRILDGEGRIVQITNNYAKMSFDFGPTLLSWLEQKDPGVYAGVLAADRESRKRYSGHGSALAQAYNHMILPLASQRDQRTQVLWGIRDFEHRFQRKPEGMWLPETAVNLETLRVLAGQGIRFTILSPRQAAGDGPVDPSQAYRVELGSGQSIAVFFYDGPIARAAAFDDLLTRGERLAERLAGAFSDDRPWPQIVHIATDGETYGHHRPNADMALAYALHYIELGGLAQLTNYGEYLERHPPTQEVRIVEDSSWSCAHGLERWRGDCGCNSGIQPGWNQRWRAPLRAALDWLRDTMAPRYESAAARLLLDPWKARDGYIEVILDRRPENVERFLARHARRALAETEQVEVLKLLELQRQTLLMYTSCGWFFDELSGVETVQVLQYAGRALQLAQELFGDGLEEHFLAMLKHARSNLEEHGDGRRVYEKLVRPAMVNLEKVAAHYAISSLFEDYGERARVYSHQVRRRDLLLLEQGRARLAMGTADIASEITRESGVMSFGVLHLGDQNVSGGVREFRGQEAYGKLKQEMTEIFERGDTPEIIRAVDRNFGRGIYSLRLLFRDEQRQIVNLILEKAMTEAAGLYRGFYSQYATLARFMTDLGIPLPARLQMAVGFTLNEDLLAALSSAEPGAQRVRGLLEDVRRTGSQIDAVTLEFRFRATLERAAAGFRADPADLDRLRRFERVAALCPLLPFPVNLWAVQNAFCEAMRAYFGEFHERAERGDPQARAWFEVARPLGEVLGVRASWCGAEAAR